MRARIFIDFWNLSLGAKSSWSSAYRINYENLPSVLCGQTSLILGAKASYEGTYVYASVDLSSEADKRLNKFLRENLDHLPGYQVRVFKRRPKHPPKCPSCHKKIATCPHCGNGMEGTVEKGVDASIVTDMLQHAWDNTYDVGVLVSSDADFIPAVDGLDRRGKKIIHAGFGSQGVELAGACWGHIDLLKLKSNMGI
jgi:uncharacterized LabA/DUF88 family protein